MQVLLYSSVTIDHKCIHDESGRIEESSDILVNLKGNLCGKTHGPVVTRSVVIAIDFATVVQCLYSITLEFFTTQYYSLYIFNPVSFIKQTINFTIAT